MIVHSTKGKSLLNDILEKCVFQEISVENAIHYDAKEMFESVKKIVIMMSFGILL